MHHVDNAIQSMCLNELAVWNSRKVDYGAGLAEYEHYNATRRCTFLIEINEGRVSILDKPAFYTREQLDVGSDNFSHAAVLYRDFIQNVVEIQRQDLHTVMAIDTDDHGLSSKNAPIFVISKLLGSNSVLLPHYEFAMYGFHELDRDEIPYSAKSLSAIFAGSTTGSEIDEKVVRQLSVPRLRSAAFFKDHPRVDFRLTRIVQCTPEAEELLRDMGFGGEFCPWEEQFRHKFIIAMDGNAGTCSRVTIALKSNSVMLKYNSNHMLHYSRYLLPWLHYVPIEADSDVESILEIEERSPGFFEFITLEGRRFFENYLMQGPIISYTGALIRMYVDSFDRARLPRQSMTRQSQMHTGTVSMISRSDVIAAYRTMLGREPENEEVINNQLSTADSIPELYRNFIECEEFRNLFVGTLDQSVLPSPYRPLDWPPIHIESNVRDAAQLATMFARVNGAWSRFGEQEPYFSVCTNQDFRGTELGERAVEFYASGQADVHYLTSFAARAGIELAGRACFELGCGVGRVTRWLGALFRRVQAVDISPGHLAIAQRVLAETGIENVSLIQIGGLEDVRQIVGYDVFFSVITLQHNPPPLIAYILMQVLTNLNPGGVAFFQVPTYGLDYKFRVDDYLNAPILDEPQLEMHVLPQCDVMRIVQATGCRLLELREDGYTGDPACISNTFFIQKRRRV